MKSFFKKGEIIQLEERILVFVQSILGQLNCRLQTGLLQSTALSHCKQIQGPRRVLQAQNAVGNSLLMTWQPYSNSTNIPFLKKKRRNGLERV